MVPGSALVHDLFTAIGVLVGGWVFVLQIRYRRRATGRAVDDRIWTVVAGALVGGALLGRLGTWAQHFDLRANATLVEHWIYGNRSILSGLVGAYLGALLAKRLTGYREKTGDLFAPAVAVGMAVGRIGCLLTELPGTPTGAAWGVTAWDGLPRHPSFAYEIAFHVVAFVVLLRLRPHLLPATAAGRLPGAGRHAAERGEAAQHPATRDDGPVPGESAGSAGVQQECSTSERAHDRYPQGILFNGFVVAYGVFRFAVEFVRGNEVVFAGLTRPQWFLLGVAPLVVWRVGRKLSKATRAQEGLA
ncbi:prolipoprotein diacylglyceryl transferase [Allorhizocola rhizosphaerae]|uniref:prolipoprotein diacylglyceryl transferase n=1 Tax=Allorhizocola rhizosphaerae TaxID=1872709 RepID=UPI001B8BDFDB|nr:prolipoprotein diacylglyceryl transferase family protein [Allorhizocola rhizosphaerae]